MSLELHEIAGADHRILNPFTHAKLISVGVAAHVRPGPGSFSCCE